MRNQRVLTFLVVADIVLSVAAVVAEIAFQWTLPEPLRKYVDQWGEPSLTPFEFVQLGLFFVVLSVTITAWISLLNWRWGPALYITALGLNALGTALSEPSVSTAAGATIEIPAMLVGGMILGLVYFSDLRERFRPQPA
jgi:hypothetical protein